MNDVLCNQICKGDLARRMQTDKLLLSLDMALRTLIFKLWGITKGLQKRKRAHSLHLFKSQPILAETDSNTKSKHWCIIYAKKLVLLSLWSYGSLLNSLRVQYCRYCKLQRAAVNTFVRERQWRHIIALEIWVLLVGAPFLAAGPSWTKEARQLLCTHVSNQPAT